MGLSIASLFGYRNGTIPISTKAWSKLEQAERLAGIASMEEDSDLADSRPPATSSDRLDRIEAALERLTLTVERIAAALEKRG